MGTPSGFRRYLQSGGGMADDVIVSTAHEIPAAWRKLTQIAFTAQIPSRRERRHVAKHLVEEFLKEIG
jgi:hypothetical protein